METRWRPGRPAGLVFQPEASWALPRPLRVDGGDLASPAWRLSLIWGAWEPGGDRVQPWVTPLPVLVSRMGSGTLRRAQEAGPPCGASAVSLTWGKGTGTPAELR